MIIANGIKKNNEGTDANTDLGKNAFLLQCTSNQGF